MDALPINIIIYLSELYLSDHDKVNLKKLKYKIP